jgi:hypothetical protein
MAKQQSTPAEREATRAGGTVDPKVFDKESPEQQDQDVFSVAELAALYIGAGGDDPRAQKIFDAAKKAGHITEKGEYVGPSENGDSHPADEMLADGIDIDALMALMAADEGDDD